MLCYHSGLHAQGCPPNIDFENGSFDGWTCYTGNVSAATGQNVISLTPSGGPIYNRHTMFDAFPGNGVDQYGGFPVNCPNGSGHSIKLGNNLGGGEAEGISYEFTIPANQNYYSLIYHYAVVFQDPNHLDYQQPRMEIEITNVTDNSIISCSSFTFYPFGSPLPGFNLSDNPGGDTPVWYKDWTAVSINLNGNAGKTIRLFFKTADCTFRRHFGYAYIDVNSECSGTFVGATYCPDDTVVHVVAPYGYQSYTWYNNTFTQVLGNQQTLTLAPPPPAGTTVAVQLIPYNGYGCLDTLYAQLIDTLTVHANAGNDALSCNHTPVQIGSPPRPGFTYNWSPAAGLSNPNISNPIAIPDTTTAYVLAIRHSGGGCFSTDTVVIKAALLDTTLDFFGSLAYCTGSGDSAVLQVKPADSIQWFRDNVPIPGAHQTRYKALQSGTYYAKLFSLSTGCTITTSSRQISIASVPVVGFTVNKPDQCLVGNSFAFTNSSTNVLGVMQYRWRFGDGLESTNRDVIHRYSKAGRYRVTLTVNSSAVCADSTSLIINVFQNPEAAFTIKPVCIGLPSTVINNTADTGVYPVNYYWDFGNGQLSNAVNPPSHIYNAAGIYPVKLSVNTAQCPSPLNTLIRYAVIEKPKPGISYPVEYGVIDLPLPLQARAIGEKILWNPATYLDDVSSYKPVFRGSTEQLYTIQMTEANGCITVDTQQVKLVKNVEIWVPNAFTPNGDGTNDLLRPLLRGIKSVNYFRIYNRWGELIFEMRSDRPGWDGTYKGLPQPAQAVVWTIEALGADNVLYRSKGTSILIR